MFGSLRNEGDAATVKVGVDTSEFTKLELAERQWRESTGAMTRDALKLDLAQDRLKNSLSKYGAESNQAKRATIALRDAEESSARAARQAGAAYERQERTLSRLSRGGLAGSGIFRGLGRSIAFASGAFLGGTGLVYGIRKSIEAAIEQDKILANLRNSLAAGGKSWDQYGARIEDVTRRTKALSGFDDEELYQSLQLLVRGTGSVTKALNLNSLAADVARGRNMDLVRAATLLVRVNAGSVNSLRRLGIIVKDGISGTQALEAVQRKYAGAAKAFGDSAAGASARFAVGIGDMEKAIGRGILPQFTELTKRAADWLNEAENQKRVQRDVAEVTKQVESAVKGLASGFQTLKTILGPVVAALGGTERTAKLVVEAFAIYKFVKIAAAIKGLATAFGFVGPAAVRNAAIAVTAENSIGTAAVANAGKVGLLARMLGGLASGPGIAGLTVGALFAYPAGKKLGEKSAHAFFQAIGMEHKPAQFKDLVQKAYAGTLDMTEIAKARQAGDITQRQMDALVYISQAVQARKSLGLALPPLSRLEKDYAKSRRGDFDADEPATAGAGRGPGGRGKPSDADLETAVDRARAGRQPLLPALVALRDRYSSEIEWLEHRKNLSEKQKAKLRSLYGAIAGVQSEIDSIHSEAAQKDKEKRDAARKKREAEEAKRRAEEKAAAEAHRKKIRDDIDKKENRLENRLREAGLSTKDLTDDRRALIALRKFYGEMAQNDELTLKERQAYAAKRLAIRKKLQDLGKKKKDAPDRDKTSGMSILSEFLQLSERYGSNFAPPGWWEGGDKKSPAEVHMHFTHVPTDFHREARFAQHAMMSVFDG